MFIKQFLSFLLFLSISLSNYGVGQTVSLQDQNNTIGICSGANPHNGSTSSFKLSDLNGALNGGDYYVFHIDLAATWWGGCYNSIGDMEDIEEYWMDPNSSNYSQHVVTFTHLDDHNQPFSCAQWAAAGSIPNNFIADDGGGYTYYSLFANDYDPTVISMPNQIWIDHTMTVRFKSNYTTLASANYRLNSMLEDCAPCNNPDLDDDGVINDVDNCPDDYNPEQSDDDGDFIGNVCDDCSNIDGDINDDMLVDVLDIVQTVNMVLSGGINSASFTDCAKSDADIDNNNIVNILDIIQVINLVLGSPRILDLESKADILITKINSDLEISISSDVDIAGLQIDIETNNNYHAYLIDNSHIRVQSNHDSGNLTILALDELMLNRPFDSRNVKLVIEDAKNLDLNSINVTLSSSSGSQIALNYIDSDNDLTVSNSPELYGLNKIYPNPFNPTTEIEFNIPNDSNVILSAYDLNGREVGVIFEGFQRAGNHSYQWNAANLPSGVYYIKFQYDSQIQSMKTVLMK